MPGQTRHNLTNVERGRLFVVASESEVVLISAAVAPTVIARISSDAHHEIAPGVPHYFFSDAERERYVGDATWESFLKLVGFELVGIPVADWTHERVLCVLRKAFPLVELATPDGPRAN